VSEAKPAGGARTLPHSLEAERAVLGSILLHPPALAEVAGKCQPRDMYHPAHTAIFEAMVELEADSKPVDAITVVDHMRTKGTAHRLKAIGGEAYFADLTAAVTVVDSAGWYAKQVAKKAKRRRWIEHAQAIAADGYSDVDDDQFLERAEKLATSATVTADEAPEYRHIADVLHETRRMVERRIEAQQPVSGVPSGHDQVDELLGGFQPGQLVVIGGRAKMAKTSLAMSMVKRAASGRNLLRKRFPTLVVELEMADVELAQRLVSDEAQVEGTKLKNGLLDRDEILRMTRACADLAESEIYTCDRPMTFSRIRRLARKWRSDPRVWREGVADVGMLVVDYLGLIGSEPGMAKGRQANREQEVAAWTRGLKALAKELRIPVVLLCQLNRGTEQRADKRPMLSDLRETGAIEQDADFVLLVYREDYYNANTPNPGIAEVIVAASRHSATGMIPLRFIGEYTRFEDLPSDWVPAEAKPRKRKGAGSYTREPEEAA
jgi:replicative DNA helicase